MGRETEDDMATSEMHEVHMAHGAWRMAPSDLEAATSGGQRLLTAGNGGKRLLAMANRGERQPTAARGGKRQLPTTNCCLRLAGRHWQPTTTNDAP